jgi:multiple sugar transport system permease protein
MVTTAATVTARAASSSEEAREAGRARRRVQRKVASHVLLIVTALGTGAYLAYTGKGEVTASRLLQEELPWLALGVGAGAILCWLFPFLARSKKTAPYVFISPFFILFAAFGLFPILFSLFLSFCMWEPSSGFAGIRFAGWDRWHGIPIPANYTYAMGDRLFFKSLGNTFWMAIASGVPQHAVGIPLAYLFHVGFRRFRNLFTGAYFLPFITSSVAIALIFSTLFSQHFGVINAGLDALARLPGLSFIPHGAEGHVNWMGKAVTVRPALSFVIFWRYLGWNTVLYLAALQAIPKELFEAAQMDGASRWQTFTRIVVPMLRPMMMFAVTLTIIGNLQLFEEPLIILGNTTGGPESSGMTAAMFMYKYGFEQSGEYGTACAISWMLFVLIAGFTWLNQWIFSRQRGAEGVA